MHISIYTYIYVHINMNIFISTHICIYTYKYIYWNKCIYIYIYIYVFISKYVSIPAPRWSALPMALAPASPSLFHCTCSVCNEGFWHSASTCWHMYMYMYMYICLHVCRYHICPNYVPYISMFSLYNSCSICTCTALAVFATRGFEWSNLCTYAFIYTYLCIY